ncbi:MAG: HAMP domain-containing histidine kinase [Alphaproteobacteria bacterium]|nr:HAMP domain-containing histidine kinase [Alphaproteobacteria bacterium]
MSSTLPPPAAEPRVLVLGAPSLARELEPLLAGTELRVTAEPLESGKVRASDLVVLDLSTGGSAALSMLIAWSRLPDEQRPAALALYDNPAHRPVALSIGDAVRIPHEAGELKDRVIGLSRWHASWHRAVVAARKLNEARALLREAEERFAALEARNQAQQRSDAEVAAYLAHEIRTPLNAIMGFSEILKAQHFGPLGDPRYPGYAADIHRSATHLARVCEDALALAKAEAGAAEPIAAETVSVGDIFDQAIAMVRDLAGDSGVRLKVEVEPNFPELRTDGSKLLQIVLNLATNAIKFTPSGGRVKLKARVDRLRGAMILVIRDTGIGMAPDDVPTALKPFGQVGRPIDGRPQGAGLGLPLTRSLVERLGGQLEIVTRPGGGTVVTVLLPRELSEAA